MVTAGARRLGLLGGAVGGPADPAVGAAIEVRSAAIDLDNPWTRLTSYLRHPYRH
jgi:hypothetical protein